MKEKVGLLVVVALLVVMLPMNVWAHTVDDPYIVDLIAGGGNVKSAMDVGDLSIWNDGELLHIRYWIEDEDWCLTETQLQVFLDDAGFSDVPHKNGNPIPGRFGFRGWHPDCVAFVSYHFPIPWAAGTEIKIAAHGVVMSGMWGLADLEAALPEQAVLTVNSSPDIDRDGDGYADSHFNVTISEDGFLSGEHPAWCADTDDGIQVGWTFPVNVYSSYEPLPAGVIDFPENLDLVNWILNQDYIGEPSPGCGGNYTWDDIQFAIWALIEDWSPPGPDLCRAHEIRDAAQANGEGFVPDCGEMVGIILAADGYQNVLIPLPVPCDLVDETIWAAVTEYDNGNLVGLDFPFPGKNWATYVKYVVQ